jgi:hypothetical protein
VCFLGVLFSTRCRVLLEPKVAVEEAEVVDQGSHAGALDQFERDVRIASLQMMASVEDVRMEWQCKAE